MAERARARRSTNEEGRRLTQIVHRGKHESVQFRRALIMMGVVVGHPVLAVAGLVAADEDTVRDVIHAFHERGLATLTSGSIRATLLRARSPKGRLQAWIDGEDQ